MINSPRQRGRYTLPGRDRADSSKRPAVAGQVTLASPSFQQPSALSNPERCETVPMIELLKSGVRRWPLLTRAYRWGYTGMRDSRLRFEAARYHPSERRRIALLRDRHKGQRCFVLGNGPSLRGVDVGRLVGEAVFTVNHFYLHRALEIVAPAYYCISDISFFDERSNPFWHRNLMRLPTTTSFFLPIGLRRRLRTALSDRDNIYYLRMDDRHEIWCDGTMSLDASGVLSKGDTVILDFCLPIAHFMGFAEIYLLGCDTDFGPTEQAVHFYDLQTPGRSARYHREIWYQNVTSSYEVARDAFEASGRRLFNATDGGRLDVLPRVTLDQVLASPPPERRGERRSPYADPGP